MSKNLKPTEDPEVFVKCLTYNLNKNYNMPLCSIRVRIWALAKNGILTFDDLIKVENEDFVKIKGIGPKVAKELIYMKEKEIWFKTTPKCKWFICGEEYKYEQAS